MKYQMYYEMMEQPEALRRTFASELDNMANIVVTIEDGTIIGGLGSKVEEILYKNKLNKKLEKFAYPDEFVKCI